MPSPQGGHSESQEKRELRFCTSRLALNTSYWCKSNALSFIQGCDGDTENKVKVELNYPISLAIISYQKRHEKLSNSLKVLRNILLREELFSY